MSNWLAFLEISEGRRFLYIPERKCPIEVVFREAQELLKIENTLLIFQKQALIGSIKGTLISKELIFIKQYDETLFPANQLFEFSRAALVPERDLYETIRMLVQGCVLKVNQKETESGVTYEYELSDENL